jgi:hypothetical protein
MIVINGCGYLGITPTATYTLEPIFMDKSILSERPCALPCWYGLFVGKSNKDDILKTIPMLSFLDKNSLNESDSGYFDYISGINQAAREISVSWNKPHARWGRFLVYNNILVEISYMPNSKLTIDELINYIGYPDFVRAYPGSPEGMEGCSIFFSWKNKQLDILHYQSTGRDLCKQANTENIIDKQLSIDGVSIEMPDFFPYIENDSQKATKYTWK